MPPSVTENRVTVLGTLNIKGTVVVAPTASGPKASGTPGLAKVTVPEPPKVRSAIWLMLTFWAAVKPVFVSWRLAVTVAPDWAIFCIWPLRLGGVQEVAEVFLVARAGFNK